MEIFVLCFVIQLQPEWIGLRYEFRSMRVGNMTKIHQCYQPQLYSHWGVASHWHGLIRLQILVQNISLQYRCCIYVRAFQSSVVGAEQSIRLYTVPHHRYNITLISYTLGREYRVMRNRYSRLLFSSEDHLCANLRVQEQSTNMASQC